MKITFDQEAALEAGAEVLITADYPWGEKCPACGRPHLFTYSDGTKLCDKCDELVVSGLTLDKLASAHIQCLYERANRGQA